MPKKPVENKQASPDTFHYEIKERLKALLENDPDHGREKLALFAARNALRQFPFMGSRGNFEYWLRKGDVQTVARHLLALWRGVILAWSGESDSKILQASAADYTYADLIKSEIKQLEKGAAGDLRIQPLWPTKKQFAASSLAEIYHDQWPESIQWLLRQEYIANHKELARQIEQMAHDYDLILNGQNDSILAKGLRFTKQHVVKIKRFVASIHLISDQISKVDTLTEVT